MTLTLVLPPAPGDLPHEWRTLRTTSEAIEAGGGAAWWWLSLLGESDAPRAPILTVSAIHHGPTAPSPNGLLLDDPNDVVPDDQWERIPWDSDDCPF